MIGDEKNLKDSSPAAYQTGLNDSSKNTLAAMPFSLSYTKTSKLITALYMVTDMIDEKEPMRNKLRTLGTEIISDVYAISVFPSTSGSIKANAKVSETISFLDIAATINIISEMNRSILRKEFLDLKQSIEESIQTPHLWNKQTDLELFFKEEPSLPDNNFKNAGRKFIETRSGHRVTAPIGHTNLGMQKGSTLMKALSDKASTMSDNKDSGTTNNNFDLLKKDRRNEIIKIVAGSSNGHGIQIGLTITDIKDKAIGPLTTCSEKTLQRELVSMVTEGVLYKTGAKRWSKYFLTQPN